MAIEYKVQAKVIIRLSADSEAKAKEIIKAAIEDGLSEWFKSTTNGNIDHSQTEIKVLGFKGTVKA